MEFASPLPVDIEPASSVLSVKAFLDSNKLIEMVRNNQLSRSGDVDGHIDASAARVPQFL